jgi:DNA polymerase (family 10)
VEFVIAATVDSLLAQLPSSFNATKKDDNNIQLSYLPIPVIIHACAAEQFEYTLFRTTGTTEFLKSFSSIDIATAISEKEIFEKSGKPYLIPEMRNGKHEWQWSAKFSNENIIDVSDIKGIIHTHTLWSDGTNSIEEMAKHCMQMGMEYLFISDHSVSAFYANGLSVERIAQQHQEIESLNKLLAPFKIFKSIECDILYDGTLDYADEVLAGFDAVIISVHSMLNMDIDKATNRLLKAIAHPYTSILGHPSGRLLLSRAGYPLHYEKIIDACAANDVVIELNANPWRLDIDWEWIYYAMNKGVKISINPDAHSLEGIHDIHYGVLAARKGGLTKAFLFNSLTLSEMEAYLLKRKTKIIR